MLRVQEVQSEHEYDQNSTYYHWLRRFYHFSCDIAIPLLKTIFSYLIQVGIL